MSSRLTLLFSYVYVILASSAVRVLTLRPVCDILYCDGCVNEICDHTFVYFCRDMKLVPIWHSVVSQLSLFATWVIDYVFKYSF
jgi:hypothetical protein